MTGFLTEPEPARGVALPVQPGIRRVVASNPGPMTYWGTNTYLIDAPDGVLVLDPGPDDAAHVTATMEAAGAPVVGILLTHTHHDHLGAVAALRARTGAPVHAWHEPADPGFVPDVALRDGDAVGDWTALHTPGHAADHLCFARADGTVFSGDHVMGWSSSVVSPPGGNMRQYFGSLQRMLARDDATYLPGHGPALPSPRGLVRALLALTTEPTSASALTDRLYADVTPALKRAAERNVIAHLLKLQEDGRAGEAPGGWVRAPAALSSAAAAASG